MRVRICLSGFGNVGRHFVRLLLEKASYVEREYGIALCITAVSEISGSAMKSTGLDASLLLQCSREEGPSAYPDYGSREICGARVLEQCDADVLVEATPTNIQDGEPGLSHIKAAVSRGLHVVTLAKGPLVVAFGEVSDLAARAGVALRFSGATAAALPAYDTGAFSLAGTEISLFEGILNGTTNYILDSMASSGKDYGTALTEAQQMGVAEPNPVLDVEGWDTACKTLILANSLFGTRLSLKDIPVTGITAITLKDIRSAKERGSVIKLLGRAVRSGDGVTVSVGPREVPGTHMFASVAGTTKAIRFVADTMGELLVVGGKSDPRAAAAAALKDIINIYRQ